VRANALFHSEDEALAMLLEERNESRVRLGMPDDYLTLFGTALMEGFVPRHPNVSLDLRYDFSHRLEQMVETRDLDVAIVTQSALDPKGEVTREERQVWCCAANRMPESSNCLHLALFPDGCRARQHILSAGCRPDRKGRRESPAHARSSCLRQPLQISFRPLISDSGRTL
jgi:DNA-binding transcriptional LysR family regulator